MRPQPKALCAGLIAIDKLRAVPFNSEYNLSRVVEGLALRNHSNQPPGGMVLIPADRISGR
jgi:hypothetical protein